MILNLLKEKNKEQSQIDNDYKKSKRRSFKRTRWSVKITSDGSDKSNYWIIRNPEGEYRTREEARKAKKKMVSGKSNHNSWKNYYDEAWYG